MNPAKTPMPPTQRQARSDGDQTRAAIIEAAGSLFGEQGYDRTTNKAICERAQVNMAAINYHFGSRENLYLVVLQEIHQRLLSITMLQELLQQDLPPAEKLRFIFHQLTSYILDRQHWALRIWLRELISPSPLWQQLEHENLQPKAEIIAELLSEVTGLPTDSLASQTVLLSTVSPFMALAVISGTPSHPLQTLLYTDSEQLADQIWRFTMAGLLASSQAAPVAPPDPI